MKCNINKTLIILCPVVTQEYNTYVNQGQVIRGNDVIMKCDIPSFVTDLLDVIHWVDNQNNVYSMNTNMGNNFGQTFEWEKYCKKLKCDLPVLNNKIRHTKIHVFSFIKKCLLPWGICRLNANTCKHHKYSISNLS